MKLIILSRDGVINEHSDDFIKTPDEWRPIAGSLDAIGKLTQAGYRVIVATNQSGLGRGIFGIDELNNIHDKMHRRLALHRGVIEAVFYCPHRPEDKCICRKPNTGLFDTIAGRLKTTLTRVPVVGDTLADLQAATAAGAVPYLVRTGLGNKTLASEKDNPLLETVPVFDNLSTFVHFLLGGETEDNQQQVL